MLDEVEERGFSRIPSRPAQGLLANCTHDARAETADDRKPALPSRAGSGHATKGEVHMKHHIGLGMAMLVGIGVGAAAVQSLHAQAKPPVYFIAEIDVTNAEGYAKEYAPQALAMI